VRAFDILGAERRLSEYEVLMVMKLKEITTEEKEKWFKKLPASYFVHVKKFKYVFSISDAMGIVGSQRLIEYFLGIDSQVLKNHLFLSLCRHGHVNVAQWFHSLGDVDSHSYDDIAFLMACVNGNLQLVQWLYSLGDVDSIRAKGNEAFRLACCNCNHDNVSVAQWLHSLNIVDIHEADDKAFQDACCIGNLAIVEWIYSLGGISLATVRFCLTITFDNRVNSWLQSILTA
jgi:hypothetical protein